MKREKIFITGGAGYIGSHVARRFLEHGHAVTVFDNFTTGYREPLEILKKKYGNLTVISGDLRNEKSVYLALKKQKPSAVMHLAARVSVDESMKNPRIYYDNNVTGTLHLLDSMVSLGIKKLVFASTGATYGDPELLPVKETARLSPVNFYGESKVLCERLIQYYGKLGKVDYVIFRFFNVCGASTDGLIGDSKKPSLLLMQNAVRGAMGLEKFELTCSEVKTPDKTPIRDYIDVEDLAVAHNRALDFLRSGKKNKIFNLGNGSGYSVKQIISEVEKVFSLKIAVKKGVARKGENAKIYADNSEAKKHLKFKPSKNLKASILSLKKWYEGHPRGYKA